MKTFLFIISLVVSSISFACENIHTADKVTYITTSDGKIYACRSGSFRSTSGSFSNAYCDKIK